MLLNFSQQLSGQLELSGLIFISLVTYLLQINTNSFRLRTGEVNIVILFVEIKSFRQGQLLQKNV